MRWARALVVVLVLSVLGGLVALAPPATARAAELVVTSTPQPQNLFPDGVLFTIAARSDQPIRSVRLTYSLEPGGIPVGADAQFEPGVQVTAQYRLRTSANYIPPGKVITYHWELKDAAGNTVTTPDARFRYDDTRFQWQEARSGNVVLHYYKGGAAGAQRLAAAGAQGVARAEDLEGVRVPFALNVWAYATEPDLLVAQQHQSAATDPGVLGQAFEPDTLLSLVTNFDDPVAHDTLRHELTHLVTAYAVSGPYEQLFPIWLNEGISVYMQGDPNDVGYVDAFQAAVKSDRIVSLVQLQTLRSSDIGLFYGESYEVVKFLVDRYGKAKLAQLLSVYKQGSTDDGAFRQVYGTDRAGVYQQFRESLRLPTARPTPTGQPSSSTGRTGDARAPVATTAGHGAGRAIIAVLIFALGALAVALVALLVALVWSRASAARRPPGGA